MGVWDHRDRVTPGELFAQKVCNFWSRFALLISVTTNVILMDFTWRGRLVCPACLWEMSVRRYAAPLRITLSTLRPTDEGLTATTLQTINENGSGKIEQSEKVSDAERAKRTTSDICCFFQ